MEPMGRLVGAFRLGRSALKAFVSPGRSLLGTLLKVCFLDVLIP